MENITGIDAKIKGWVSQIQRFSVSDGPGIRTTVFLKGCPLRCGWCHNPETANSGPSLLYYAGRCVSCGACAAICPNGAHTLTIDAQASVNGAQTFAIDALASVNGAHTLTIGAHALDRAKCAYCGACASVCPGKALEIRGAEMAAEDVMKPVLRDMPFYETTGGGITVSGGEPLSQFTFTKALLASAKQSGLHTCLDTSGFGTGAESLLPWTDLYLWDIKETDEQRHLKHTGVRLAPILDNLRKVDAAGSAVLLRCPIISGVNDRREHMQAVGAIARRLKNLKGIDLVAYHNLGAAKAIALGMSQNEFNAPGEAERETLLSVLRENVEVPCRWHQ